MLEYRLQSMTFTSGRCTNGKFSEISRSRVFEEIHTGLTVRPALRADNYFAVLLYLWDLYCAPLSIVLTAYTGKLLLKFYLLIVSNKPIGAL